MVMFYILATASLLTGVVLCIRIIHLTERFTHRRIPPLPASLNELPTVSVCIPARNETHAMTQCLERVVASAYPKLEIIVLDDSSVDNTSILIKSFAHAGVRFVEGSPLPPGWIGKTHAQQELYRESSGDYILYLDVDTHLSPYSVDALVAAALYQNASVVSVLPTRNDAWRASVLFATLRYFWAVLAHGQKRPAVSSSAWLVKRTMLEEAFNGLETLKSAIVPESNVANHAIERNEYCFLMSTSQIGVSYEKKWRSQCDTSIRLLYPLLGSSFAGVFLFLLLIAFLLAPFVVVATGIFFEWSSLHSLCLAASVTLLTSYAIYTAQVWRRGWLAGGILFPVILVQEMFLLIQSVYAYHTNTVSWKGRPIQRSDQTAVASK